MSYFGWKAVQRVLGRRGRKQPFALSKPFGFGTWTRAEECGKSVMVPAVFLAVAIATPAPAITRQDAPPPPPPELIGDYFPGPWAFFFAEGGTRLSPAPDPSLRGIADMAKRLPGIGIELCASDAVGAPTSSRVRQRRLAKVAAFVRRAGIKHVTLGTEASCASEQPRDAPAVIARPSPGSRT